MNSLTSRHCKHEVVATKTSQDDHNIHRHFYQDEFYALMLSSLRKLANAAHDSLYFGHEQASCQILARANARLQAAQQFALACKPIVIPTDAILFL
ncbi:MAG: hypothetical protein GY801_39175 [bacterium]|nr:hypothetical protein [bacterium]